MGKKKGITLLSFSTLADLGFFVILVVSFSVFIGWYLNSDDQVTAFQIARTLSFSLKQALAGGDETEIVYTIPQRYCEIEVSNDKIYVSTEENWAKRGIEAFLSKTFAAIAGFFGMEVRFAVYEMENPVGKYMADKYKIKCSKFYKKKLKIKVENDEIKIFESAG